MLARRQAGSTLKPFLYELAFEKRLITPASLLDDSPAQIATGAGLYMPQNYDHDFKGFVSARTALGASLNVPAVRVGAMVGTDALLDAAQRARPGAARKRRLLRRLARARQRRRDAARADQRLSRARQRRPLRAGRDARPARPRRAGARRRPGRDLHRHRHPRRQQRARPHLRLGQPAGDARLRRGQDRHQQGHARQLVRRLHRPLHGRRLGRQRERRADARRHRRQRRGAGLAARSPAYLHAGAPSRPPRRRPASSRRGSPSTRSARPARDEVFLAGSERALQRASARGRRRRSATASPARATAASSRSIPTSRRRRSASPSKASAARWRLDGRALGVGRAAALGAVAGPPSARAASSASGQTLQSVALRGARRRRQAGAPAPR